MSVHDLARAASADLRAHTVADVDAGLDALFAAHTQRRRHSQIAVTLVVAAAVLLGWWGISGVGRQASTLEPSRHPSTGSTTLPAPPADGLCHSARVTCLGDRAYLFRLNSPLNWQIPRGYGVNSGGGATSNMVESYSANGPGGITVMEDVRAASLGSGLAPGVPPTAEGFVRWLAQRPYLNASRVRRTTLGGRDAWHVRVSLRPHVPPGPGRCITQNLPCYPITFQDPSITGIWGDMTADYTATDLPGSGTAVVWSWAFGHDLVTLHRNAEAIAGLRWSTG